MFTPPTDEVKTRRSEVLNRIVPGNGRPDINVMMDPIFFPFIETARRSISVDYGVIHLMNIPFNTSRPEIIALFGRNSKILNDNDEPVHIIMERVTSKTHDAYVEFETFDDAMNAFSRLYGNSSRCRVPRLGDRPVELEVSSQCQLMRDLFPIARGIVWHGSMPEITPHNVEEPWDNFKTFVTAEEMTMLVKHVEVPQRSPFSRDCPERAYECMISTIKKLPWHMTECITLRQRHYVWDACCKLVCMLMQSLDPKSGRHERAGADRLTSQLLRRFTNAIMLCPGFTVCQKDNVASLVRMHEPDMRKFNMPRFANAWVHQYTLGPKPGTPLDVLEYYVAIIREETNRAVANMPINEKQELAELAQKTDGYWGYFWREVGYPRGPHFDDTTLAKAALMEWKAMDQVLRRALADSQNGNHNGKIGQSLAITH
ncbi:hypothetical protein BJ170DRAFT_578288 [Xylariales sp. AK1849]|nr:hypothetical protein BJ170DRAFT_578288 [Xylariales sp. AK1849]